MALELEPGERVLAEVGPCRATASVVVSLGLSEFARRRRHLTVTDRRVACTGLTVNWDVPLGEINAVTVGRQPEQLFGDTVYLSLRTSSSGWGRFPSRSFGPLERATADELAALIRARLPGQDSSG